MGGFPKLTILSEQLRGKTFELNKDMHTVGRIEERDICIMDPTISTYHCSLIKSGNTYIRVNNVPITEQELQNSDIIQMGDVEMLYDCDDKTTQTETRTQTGIDLNKNVISSSTIKKMDAISPYSKSAANATSRKNQRLLLIVLGVMVVVILGLLGMLFYILFSTEKPQAAANFPSARLVQVFKV